MGYFNFQTAEKHKLYCWIFVHWTNLSVLLFQRSDFQRSYCHVFYSISHCALISKISSESPRGDCEEYKIGARRRNFGSMKVERDTWGNSVTGTIPDL